MGCFDLGGYSRPSCVYFTSGCLPFPWSGFERPEEAPLLSGSGTSHGQCPAHLLLRLQGVSWRDDVLLSESAPLSHVVSPPPNMLQAAAQPTCELLISPQPARPPGITGRPEGRHMWLNVSCY